MPALIREIVFTEVLADHRRIKYCLGPNLSPSNFLEGSCLCTHTLSESPSLAYTRGSEPVGVSAQTHVHMMCGQKQHLITSWVAF